MVPSDPPAVKARLPTRSSGHTTETHPVSIFNPTRPFSLSMLSMHPLPRLRAPARLLSLAAALTACTAHHAPEPGKLAARAPTPAVSRAEPESERDEAPPARLLGEVSTWCGKVNVHRSRDRAWSTDDDCVSGCNRPLLPYCQKFWPSSTQVLEIERTPEKKPFVTRACARDYPSRGAHQYACLGPQARARRPRSR